MRLLMLSFSLYAGVAQSTLVVDSVPKILGFALSLSAMTGLAYKLGVWRQEMENMKHNVAQEIVRQHERTAVEFRRLDARLGAIEKFIESAIEQRVAIERWQSRVDSALESQHPDA
jgi:hypothetical protein